MADTCTFKWWFREDNMYKIKKQLLLTKQKKKYTTRAGSQLC